MKAAPGKNCEMVEKAYGDEIAAINRHTTEEG